MRFRTEIEAQKAPFRIEHDTPVLLLGSCFTDEIGARLEYDGLEVLRNPFGPLYNPLSILNCLHRAADKVAYTEADLVEGPRGYHCLDYASRYSGSDAAHVLADINATQARLYDFVERKPLVVITLGSAYVYFRRDNGLPAGNCHKFPPSTFERRLLETEEVCAAALAITAGLAKKGAGRVIFTVSPIRHLADGLHGNQLGKATLLLGLDKALREAGDATYFPSYEIMLDDLRDYRFYASDMKHPSDTAADYIYKQFSETFFTKDCANAALEARRRHKASLHRQIL